MSYSVMLFQGCSPQPLALYGTECSRRARPLRVGSSCQGSLVSGALFC